MERLTKRVTDGQAMMDCEKCKAEWTGKHGKSMVDCTPLYCRNRLKDRVAAYEETGLTPEQCENAKAIIESDFSDDTSKAERIRELLKADRDGRLVVLPCKVGEKLWVIGRDSVPREMELEAPDIRTVCTDEDNLCMATCNRKPDGFCAYRLRNDGTSIGKTVFLTREEAEKALEAKRDVCP